MSDIIVNEIHIKAPSDAPKAAYEAVEHTKKKIRELQKERREKLLANEEYRKVKAEQLEANREVNFEKKKLLRMPEFIALEDQIDKLKGTKETQQLTLFTELDRYIETTKTYVLPLDDNGTRRVIEPQFKLLKD